MLVGGISWNNVICPSLRRQYSLVVGGDEEGGGQQLSLRGYHAVYKGAEPRLCS